MRHLTPLDPFGSPLVRRVALAIITFAISFLSTADMYTAAAPAYQANDLLTPTSQQGTRAISQDPSALRSQHVIVDFTKLPVPMQVVPTPFTLSITPFNDAKILVVIDHAYTNQTRTGVVLRGKVQSGDPFSEVLLSTDVQGKDPVLYAIIRPAADILYEVTYAGGGIHTVRQIDTQRISLHSTPLQPPMPSSRTGSAVSSTPDNGNFIDVFVVYTRAARDRVGGSNAMVSLINASIEDTSQGYRNSGIQQRLRLVGSAETPDYQEGTLNDSIDFVNDLNRLQNMTGDMDEIHTLRNTHGADYVVLLRTTGRRDLCGIAYMNDSNDDPNNPDDGPINNMHESTAFAVVDVSCSVEQNTFAHELGHAMGIHHNIENDPSGTSINHGFCQSNILSRFRDIMAVQVDENGNQTINCALSPRINHWSNPNIPYQGYATGNDRADSQQALTNALSALPLILENESSLTESDI